MEGQEVEKKVEIDKIEIPAAESAIPIPEGYSSEEWQDLSRSEQEGIVDSIKNPTDAPEDDHVPTPEELAALEEIAKDGEEEKTVDEKPVEEPEKKVDEQPVEEKPTEEKPAESAQLVSDVDLLSYRPVVSEDDLKVEVEEVIPEALKTKKAELTQKFDDGDITREQYDDERDALNRQIMLANSSSVAAAREKKREAIIWGKEQEFFLAAHPEFLVKKDEAADIVTNKEVVFSTLKAMVRQISSDPKNAHLSGMQVLIKADKAISGVKEAYGLAPKKEVKKDVKPVEKKEVKPSAKDELKKDDVKTLSGLPAAGTGNVEDAFAQLDKMTGEAYENALASLKPEVREAYEKRV
jgi:hypothetical protein